MDRIRRAGPWCWQEASRLGGESLQAECLRITIRKGFAFIPEKKCFTWLEKFIIIMELGKRSPQRPYPQKNSLDRTVLGMSEHMRGEL